MTRRVLVRWAVDLGLVALALVVLWTAVKIAGTDRNLREAMKAAAQPHHFKDQITGPGPEAVIRHSGDDPATERDIEGVD